jgi:hypothetical protein
VLLCACYIDIKSLQNRLLKVCYAPATSTSLNRLFLLQPLALLLKQTRQVVHTIKQSNYLDVYGLLLALHLAFVSFFAAVTNSTYETKKASGTCQ